MKLQKEPVEDATQPYTETGPIIRHYTAGSFGAGMLNTRYNISNSQEKRQSYVSWKDDFKGGPDIFVHEPEGNKRLVNEGDFGERRVINISDTEGSEHASTVEPVCDLGFSAVPTKSLQQFRQFNLLWENNEGDPETELFMSVDELEEHLGREGRSSNTIQQLVEGKMEERFQRSQKDDEDYLPISAFEDIFDIETIKSLVKEAHPKDTKLMWLKKVAQIVGTEPNQCYRRILGILVLMGRVPYIDDFIREGIKDFDLPIKRSRGNGKEFKTCTSVQNSTLFSNWNRSCVELFYVYQKMLFVPFFDIREDKLCSYQFDESVRLPWKDYTQKSSGGSGLVHKIQIHPKHHSFRTSNDPEKPLYFALKEISAFDRDAYRRELWALQKSTYQTQREKHLIKLLLTFEHGDKCYFLFEWADGNLAEFWDQSDITPAPSDTWAAQQCLGISNAIKRIHGLTTWQKKQRSLGTDSDDERGWGRHGDIKPNNILWFSEYGNDPQNILHHHLVVSDLGLTRYNSQATRSAVHWLHIEGCTWAYRPPEMDMEHMISQKYDIWSLGCVFLEFCVWYVEGGKAVQIFGLNRTHEDKSEIERVKEDKYFNVITDDQGGKRASLKPIVEACIARLRDADKCSPFVRRMLNLIEEGMLIIDPKKRWKIDQICTEICEIKGSLDPATELADAVGIVRLIPADPEIPSEDRSSVELNASQIDTLVNHAEGNSGDRFAENRRRQSLSIRSENSNSENNAQDSQSTEKSTSDEPKDRRPQATNSKGTQTTPEMRGISTLHELPLAKSNLRIPVPKPRPGSIVKVEAEKVKAIETQDIASINAGITGLNPLDSQTGYADSSWRRHLKTHVWTKFRNKVKIFTHRTSQNRGQTKDK